MRPRVPWRHAFFRSTVTMFSRMVNVASSTAITATRAVIVRSPQRRSDLGPRAVRYQPPFGSRRGVDRRVAAGHDGGGRSRSWISRVADHHRETGRWLRARASGRCMVTIHRSRDWLGLQCRRSSIASSDLAAATRLGAARPVWAMRSATQRVAPPSAWMARQPPRQAAPHRAELYAPTT